jgi:hypothetical protein
MIGTYSGTLIAVALLLDRLLITIVSSNKVVSLWNVKISALLAPFIVIHIRC